MGRRKIEITPITHEHNRNVTFRKRKQGLFKKAYELGVLCSVDVALIIFEERPGRPMKLHQYSSTDINSIVQRHIHFNGYRDTISPADFKTKMEVDALGDGDDEDVDEDEGGTHASAVTVGWRRNIMKAAREREQSVAWGMHSPMGGSSSQDLQSRTDFQVDYPPAMTQPSFSSQSIASSSTSRPSTSPIIMERSTPPANKRARLESGETFTGMDVGGYAGGLGRDVGSAEGLSYNMAFLRPPTPRSASGSWHPHSPTSTFFGNNGGTGLHGPQTANVGHARHMGLGHEDLGMFAYPPPQAHLYDAGAGLGGTANGHGMLSNGHPDSAGGMGVGSARCMGGNGRGMTANVFGPVIWPAHDPYHMAHSQRLISILEDTKGMESIREADMGERRRRRPRRVGAGSGVTSTPTPTGGSEAVGRAFVPVVGLEAKEIEGSTIRHG